MKIPKWLLYVLAWMLIGVSTYPANLAYFQHKYAMSNSCREQQAYFIGWGAFSGPVGFVLTPFLTGFYQNGLQFGCAGEK